MPVKACPNFKQPTTHNMKKYIASILIIGAACAQAQSDLEVEMDALRNELDITRIEKMQDELEDINHQLEKPDDRVLFIPMIPDGLHTWINNSTTPT